MHLKRQESPKKWPILRKGTTFVIRPDSNLNEGIPILVVLRDMLKVVQDRKEAKRAIHLKHILLNSKAVKDEKKSASLFDTLTIVPSKEHYQISLSKKGKFELKKVKEAEANTKVAKVSDKRILKGGKIQLNLIDGRNFLSDIQCKTGDSVLINFKNKKIERCLPFREKARVMVFEGKHIGEEGIVKEINAERRMAKLDIGEKEVNVLIKQLMVIE